MSLPEIDRTYLIDQIKNLLNIPSPTGFTHNAINLTLDTIKMFPELQPSTNKKGALIIEWAGDNIKEKRALTAHIDTLGAMVKQVKTNGRLQLSRIGSFSWNTVEGEGCTVYTNNGEAIRGSLLPIKASKHVYGEELIKLTRDDENMEVRLDVRTNSDHDTRKLGVEVGDFVAFDPRLEINNQFVRSRYLDDKACIACIFAAVKALHDEKLKPAYNTILHISNYEEVGHGASTGIPSDVTELVALDMAAVGEGQNSDEFHATLCVKDSGGPYHYQLNQRLRNIAEKHHIDYKVDIYPFYGSDGEAYWRAGGDVAVSLIGPGVDASHNYERTHIDALIATTQWIIAYLLEE